MKYSLLLVALFFSLSLKAINKYQAELDSLLAINTTDTAKKFDIYVKAVSYYKRRNIKLQKLYLDSAKQLFSHIEDPRLLQGYYYNYGLYLYGVSQYDSSIVFIKKCLQYTNKDSPPLMYGRMLNNIGRSFAKNDQSDSALFYYNNAIAFYNNLDTVVDVESVAYSRANTYTNIGSLYLNIADYDESITYYYRALRLYEQSNQQARSASVLVNIGNIYLYHKEYHKALKEYGKSLDILSQYKNKRKGTRASVLTNMGVCYKALDQKDTALLYYNNALIIRELIGPKTAIAGLYDNIGNLKKSQGDYSAALSYFQQSLEIRKEGNAPRWMASSFASLGLLYVEMKQSRKAIGYLNKAIIIAEEHGFAEINLESKNGLSQAYKDIGDYKKSLNYYIEYRELNDSIHDLKIEAKLSEYKQKYESEKKDRLIEKLEEKQKLDNLEAEKQKVLNDKQRLIMNSLAGAAILLIIILLILQRYFKMKRKADHELFEKNEQLNQQKTLELMKELEMGSIGSFMEGQEKERSRIAADLHDRLGSLLSTVRLHFNSLDEDVANDADTKQRFDFALQLLDNSVSEVRAVSHNLSKGVLAQFGLIAAVENMRDAINSAGKIKMEVMSFEVDSRLDSEAEISLFRVIQELITNVIRHAQTDEVFVQFTGAESHISILVEDHGIGFDKEQVKSNGMGIDNLKNRVQEVGGDFTIDSILGEGTTIIIDVPYKKEDDNEPESTGEV